MYSCLAQTQRQGFEPAGHTAPTSDITSSQTCLNADESQHVCCRLREADSTFQKRLAWAQGQGSAAVAPGLFDFSLNDSSRDEAYTALKEAVATISPEVCPDCRFLTGFTH